MKLKSVLIMGHDLLRKPHLPIFNKIKVLYEKKNFLLIGDGQRHVDINELYQLQNQIDANTRIDIWAHGGNEHQDYIIELGSKPNNIKGIFNLLGTSAGNSPLHVHIWGCLAGAAHRHVLNLPSGSVLVSHSQEHESTSTPQNLFALAKDLSKLGEKTKTPSPYQSFIDNLAYDSINTGFFSTHIQGKEHHYRIQPDFAKVVTNPGEELQRIVSEFQDFYANLRSKKTSSTYKTTPQYLKKNKLESKDFTEEQSNDFRLLYFFYKCSFAADDEIFTILNDPQYQEIIQHHLINKEVGYMDAMMIAVSNPRLTKQEKTKGNKIVKFLLEKGFDPNFTSEAGESALNIAYQAGNQKVVELLLKHNANPDIAAQLDGMVPLHLAVVQGDNVTVKLLLHHKANPDIVSSNGSTPLYLAVTKNNTAIVETLLKNKADPNKVISDIGATPITYAILDNQRDIIELFIKYKADLNKGTIDGDVPLFMAIETNNKGNLGLLLENNADPNLVNKKGWSASHYAAKAGNMEIVEIIAKCTLKPILAANDGRTPINVAKQYKHIKVAAFLQQIADGKQKYNPTVDCPFPPKNVANDDNIDKAAEITVSSETVNVHGEIAQYNDEL